MKQERLKNLLDKYLSEQHLSDEEKSELATWYHLFDTKEGVESFLTPQQQDALKEKLWLQIQNTTGSQMVSTSRRQKYIGKIAGIAAAVAILIGISYYASKTNRMNNDQQGAVTEQTAVNDIPPGGNKAVLTLADGSQIPLDSVGNGAVTTQGNATIFKPADGELSYSGESGMDGATATYNTVSTPRGGQYQLTLQDGTKVWLNAESSLRFPAAFSGKERIVTLEGEGYFEVTSNTAQPFFVHVGDMEIKVTGTHFNVKAYRNEQEVQTTLLRGKVAVREGSSEVALLPGQQAELNRFNSKLTAKNEVDISKVMAWRNGEFVFDDTELKEAMRTLSRWYDFDAEYDESVRPTYLYGSISREKSLSSVLKMMEELGIHFKIEKNGGKNKVIVY